MSKLAASIQTVATLPQHLPGEMYALYAQYYAGTSEDIFFRDLSAKDYIILLYDTQGTLRGFSTVAIIETMWHGKPLRAIFSGDTIIHHIFWGEQVLISSWFELAGRIKRAKPDIGLYWFLIVKGHRTYRMLHVFCKEYAPRRSQATPKHMTDLMHHLANLKFSDYYSPETGLIDFGESQGHLKPECADAEQSVNRNTEIAYFLSRNPEYGRGVELVCLAELAESNLRYFALKGFKKGLYESDSMEQSAGNL